MKSCPISIHAPRTGSDGMFAAGDDFKIISTHAPRTARKSIFKLWKMCYTVRMDRTTLIDFFEKVETNEEYNGYFCSIAEASELWCWAACAGSGT